MPVCDVEKCHRTASVAADKAHRAINPKSSVLSGWEIFAFDTRAQSSVAKPTPKPKRRKKSYDDGSENGTRERQMPIMNMNAPVAIDTERRAWTRRVTTTPASHMLKYAIGCSIALRTSDGGRCRGYINRPTATLTTNSGITSRGRNMIAMKAA